MSLLARALFIIPVGALLPILWGLVAAPLAAAQQLPAREVQKLAVSVEDENKVPVSGAHLTLVSANNLPAERGETDYAGRYEFTGLTAGVYELHVEKEGFYAVIHKDVQVGETANVDVTLNHVQEYTERVDVIYSPPAIDPQKTSDTKTLGSEEILNLPLPVDRDIRYALPLLPGVVQDSIGQVHIDGSSTRQAQDQLDGFNVTDPATGFFDMRVSIDALKSAEVYSSRYSTEFGKGSGGVVSLRTGMGDNRFRHSVTDFFPSLQTRKGLHLSTWAPRAMVTGPLSKNHDWFLEAIEGEYDLEIVPGLPSGADRSPAWRISNLAKTQFNLTSSNILTASFLVNRFGADHLGLSQFSPLETTLNETESAYLFTLKDQVLFPGGTLLEAGVGGVQFLDGFHPLGTQTYVIRPEGTSGNYFESGDGRERRFQGIANLFLPPAQALGRHEFKLGLDVDRLTYNQSYTREPYLIYREDKTLSQKVTFSGGSSFLRDNVEGSAYAQDRWAPNSRWVLEPGVRFDWDEVVRDVLVSPRLASSHLLSRRGDTKLAWGVGYYYDASNLDFLSRSLSGQRFDSFYDSTGQNLLRPPVETLFLVNDRQLLEPRFLNWSVELEQRLPQAIFLRVQFVQKRGRHGWAYFQPGTVPPGQFTGLFELTNQRKDRYDALEFTMSRKFRGNHEVFASYTRSSARSNADFNFSLDSTLFSQQAGGPFAWDTPDRFISWAWMPLPWHLDLGYSVQWRDGHPFYLVNQEQQLVAPQGARRFPRYFSLDLNLERRFTIFGLQWALRGGFDNLTNHFNPWAVDNNINSSTFLAYGGSQGRALTGRIRLLGRK